MSIIRRLLASSAVASCLSITSSFAYDAAVMTYRCAWTTFDSMADKVRWMSEENILSLAQCIREQFECALSLGSPYALNGLRALYEWCEIKGYAAAYPKTHYLDTILGQIEARAGDQYVRTADDLSHLLLICQNDPNTAAMYRVRLCGLDLPLTQRVKIRAAFRETLSEAADLVMCSDNNDCDLEETLVSKVLWPLIEGYSDTTMQESLRYDWFVKAQELAGRMEDPGVKLRVMIGGYLYGFFPESDHENIIPIILWKLNKLNRQQSSSFADLAYLFAAHDAGLSQNPELRISLMSQAYLKHCEPAKEFLEEADAAGSLRGYLHSDFEGIGGKLKYAAARYYLKKGAKPRNDDPVFYQLAFCIREVFAMESRTSRPMTRIASETIRRTLEIMENHNPGHIQAVARHCLHIIAKHNEKYHIFWLRVLQRAEGATVIVPGYYNLYTEQYLSEEAVLADIECHADELEAIRSMPFYTIANDDFRNENLGGDAASDMEFWREAARESCYDPMRIPAWLR